MRENGLVTDQIEVIYDAAVAAETTPQT